MIGRYVAMNKIIVDQLLPKRTNISLVLTVCALNQKEESEFKNLVAAQLQQCVDDIQTEELGLVKAKENEVVKVQDLEKVILRKVKVWQ